MILLIRKVDTDILKEYYSIYSDQYADLAQLVEQLTCNQ